MGTINFISAQADYQSINNEQGKTEYKPSKIQSLWQKSQEKVKDFAPKYASVPLESVNNVKYIFDYNNCSSCIDGEIGHFKQRQNDCWLLSGVNALSNTKQGRDIIKKSIKKNFDNSITLHLKGVNYTITIPNRTFEAAKFSKAYVCGDDDMLAIELATEFYKRELLQKDAHNKQNGPNVINGKMVMGKMEDPLSGGYSSDIMYLLTGKHSTTYYNLEQKVPESIIKSIEKIKASPDKYAITCNFKKQQNGLYIHHSYALKKVDQDSVVLINPHDTAKEEVIPLKDFLNNVLSLTILEL